MTLTERCNKIGDLFEQLEEISGKLLKEELVQNWRKDNPELEEDLDFCFEVLAGKHKLGYTYQSNIDDEQLVADLKSYTIKQFVEFLKSLSATDDDKWYAVVCTPYKCRWFIGCLVNREWRLGYSNKNNMITDLSPMLAKKYPDDFIAGKRYYIQEKLDGNRCIAYFDYDEQKWKFQSRSGKPLKVDFNMDWARLLLDEYKEYPIFDGEIMTLGKAGSRDFNTTSGAINGKFTDKSALHYYIYDIVAPKLTYKERKEILDKCNKYIEEEMYIRPNCTILKVLDTVELYPNPDYNTALDVWLDKIVDKGGEGIILRDPDAVYQCGKRTNALLKYKKVQTMDLRIVGWNEGNGKYIGAIGSFICQTDDSKYQVNVSGMPDDMHYSDPNKWMNKIIEVAYFDVSQSKNNSYKSLRFPRLKRIRDDKDTTSIY